MRIGKSGIVRMPVCRRTAKAEDPDRPGRFADRKPLHIEIRSAQRMSHVFIAVPGKEWNMFLKSNEWVSSFFKWPYVTKNKKTFQQTVG